MMHGIAMKLVFNSEILHNDNVQKEPLYKLPVLFPIKSAPLTLKA